MPVVIKPHSRSKGQNVTLCTEGRHIFDAVEKIFDHHSEYYDYVALAEEYIAPDREFRVVIFNREIVLMYEKDVREATFVGNLSPLHWQGAKAVVVTDKEIIGKMSDFIAPIFNELDINYAGLDVILGRDGKFYLIEVNTLIGFSHFVKDNGDAPIIDLYENILAKSFNLPIKNHPLDGSVKNDFSSQGAMVRE
jgi:glutathione synthase/RimK-type ligase-like ATP-grasp enzyme